MDETTQAVKQSWWALVEVMGHHRLAGLLEEIEIAGHGFIRVSVPAVGGRAGFDRILSTGAIYAITPTDEATARAAAEAWQVRPLETWDVQQILDQRQPAPRLATGEIDDPEDCRPW